MSKIRGRPILDGVPGTLYKPEYPTQAEKLCLLGATDVELADFFGVETKTIQRWRVSHPEFGLACKTGKESCDERVEQALYHRAIGYSYDTVKILADGTKIPYREYCPPDTAAAFIWLKNRRKDVWRDRKEVEVGGPGEFDRLTDEDLRRFITDGIAQAGESYEGIGTPSSSLGTPRKLN